MDWLRILSVVRIRSQGMPMRTSWALGYPPVRLMCVSGISVTEAGVFMIATIGKTSNGTHCCARYPEKGSGSRKHPE